jgi:hypothetical protein
MSAQMSTRLFDDVHQTQLNSKRRKIELQQLLYRTDMAGSEKVAVFQAISGRILADLGLRKNECNETSRRPIIII